MEKERKGFWERIKSYNPFSKNKLSSEMLQKLKLQEEEIQVVRKQIDEKRIKITETGYISAEENEELFYLKEKLEKLKKTKIDNLIDDESRVLKMFKNNQASFYSGEETDGEVVDCNSVVVLDEVSYRLRDNKEVVLAAINSDCRNFQFMSDRLKNNKEFILQITNSIDPIRWHVSYILEEYDKSQMEQDYLYYLSDRLKDDKDIALNMIKISTNNFLYVSDRLKNDENFILEAIKIQKWGIEKIIPEKLRDNKNFMLEACKIYPKAISLASDKLKDSKEMVMEVMAVDGSKLKYVSDRLKNDEDVVLAAVKNFGWSLINASDRLKDKKEIVLEAVKNNNSIFEYVSDRLKNDVEVCLTALKNGTRFYEVGEKIQREYSSKEEFIKDNGQKIQKETKQEKAIEVTKEEAPKRNRSRSRAKGNER